MDQRKERPASRPVKPGAGRAVVADEGAETRTVAVAGLKAGVVGAIGASILLLINLVNLPLLPCLVVPGFIVVLLVTGMLAGLMAGDRLKTPGQATRAGITAGFVAGLGAGFMAVVLSAFGLMFTELGEGVRTQFTSLQLRNLAEMGISGDAVRMAGAVALAFIIWGIAGTIVAVILGALGARLYYRLR